MMNALVFVWIMLVTSATRSLNSPLLFLFNVLTWPLAVVVLVALPRSLGPFGEWLLRFHPSPRQQKKIIAILVEIGHVKPLTQRQLVWLHAQGRAMACTHCGCLTTGIFQGRQPPIACCSNCIEKE